MIRQGSYGRVVVGGWDQGVVEEVEEAEGFEMCFGDRIGGIGYILSLERGMGLKVIFRVLVLVVIWI